MKTVALLFALPAVISALDIRFYSSFDCTGDSWICTNWNPDVRLRRNTNVATMANKFD
jgi:hypothetical protein